LIRHDPPARADSYISRAPEKGAAFLCLFTVGLMAQKSRNLLLGSG
jgi:hypothetical protein